MASEDEKRDSEAPDVETSETPEVSLATAAEGSVEGLEAAEAGEEAPASLGALKYVHAAFLTAGIIVAYVGAKIIALAWAQLAAWPAAVNALPQLVSYTEEQREGATLVAGALIGALMVLQIYRKEATRRWADEVAGELTKVTWPTREVVMNGTLVVVLASAIATAYVAILDRFWSFLTTLVYGA